MTFASDYNFIPATCEGMTSSPSPIFRCATFVETGGDAKFVYGYICNKMFCTDAERSAHQEIEHAD